MATGKNAKSLAYERWVAESVVPIAHSHGLAGRGPTFRKRDGDNWILFFLERYPLDPAQAQAFADDPRLETMRAALGHADGVTRGLAAEGLGHLHDADGATWQRVLALSDDPEAPAEDVGVAIVLLAGRDIAKRRQEGLTALERLETRDPSWGRELRAYQDQVARFE